MFILQLNDMRSANVENMTTIGRGETPEELMAFVENEKVEPYRSEDDRWHKEFKAGGPLEWYNPPWSLWESIVDVGTEDEWAVNARLDFDNRVMCLPDVKLLCHTN